jgi:hypothetical protein
MRQDMRQYLLGLKILGLAGLIGVIVIGGSFIFVGPIVMGLFKNPSAAITALGKAFVFAVVVSTVWAFAKYIMKGQTNRK